MASRVVVLPLNRWGRVLVEAHEDSGGSSLRVLSDGVRPGESPDRAALRVAEAATGVLLEDLRLYRVFGATDVDLDRLTGERVHVYFDDPDFEVEGAQASAGGPSLRYVSLPPGEDEAAAVEGTSLELLRLFAASPAYRALFH